MRYSGCVPGCKSNYQKDEPNVTVFKFPSIGKLRQKWLQNITQKVRQNYSIHKSMYKTRFSLTMSFLVSQPVFCLQHILHTFFHQVLVILTHHMSIPSQPTTSNYSCDRLNTHQLSQFFTCPSLFHLIMLLSTHSHDPC